MILIVSGSFEATITKWPARSNIFYSDFYNILILYIFLYITCNLFIIQVMKRIKILILSFET